MDKVSNGGPAFPVDCNWQDGVPTSGVQTSNGTGMATGVTVRDYFAAKAMAAYLADPTWREDMDGDQTARAAYHMADAMLAARGAP